jgi:hypothetical protein
MTFRKITQRLFLYLVLGGTVLSAQNAVAQSATNIRFYAHPGFEFYTNRSQNASSPYFRGGPLVFFVSSQISERVSVAGEMNMHYMATTGAEVE